VLNNLLYAKKKLCSTRLPEDDPVEAVLALIHQEKNLETGVLACTAGNRTLLLFVLQDDLYAACELMGNQVKSLLISDCLKQVSESEGELGLYEISPVLFKAILCLGQLEPKVLGASNFIDIEQLLSHIDQEKEEAVLLLRQGEELNLFYFSEGVLCDAYLEETEEMREEPELRDKLLLYAYASQENPVSILLYEDIIVSPESDCKALENKPAEGQVPDPQVLDSQEKKESLIPLEVQAEDMPSSEISGLSEDLDEVPHEVPHIEKRCDPQIDKVQESLPEAKENGVETLLEEIPVSEKLLEKSPEILADPSSEKRPDLWLEVLSGDRVGLLIRLASERLSFGRGKVDVRFSDPQISRYHAELKRSPSGLTLTDQHSTNGVFVNGKKITKEELSVDDVIRIGDTSLKVIYSK